jgi:hypothetical protein
MRLHQAPVELVSSPTSVTNCHRCLSERGRRRSPRLPYIDVRRLSPFQAPPVNLLFVLDEFKLFFAVELLCVLQACTLGPWSSARQLVSARGAAAEARKERLQGALEGDTGAAALRRSAPLAMRPASTLCHAVQCRCQWGTAGRALLHLARAGRGTGLAWRASLR